MKARTYALIENKIWSYLEIAPSNRLAQIKRIIEAILKQRDYDY